MRLKIEISCGNAAFENYPGLELARILSTLADQIRRSHTGMLGTFKSAGGRELRASSGKLMDINGNTCGAWQITGDKDEQ
jgi:hypothetical protein